MEYALLRSLRVLGPGLILLSYFDLFKVLMLDGQPFFWALDTSKVLLIGYIIGGLYGAITPRFGKDRIAFYGVHANLLNALSSIEPTAAERKWSEISPIFYGIIDNDNSLTIKSKGIYFNGLMVTTAVDCSLISSFAALGGIGIGCYTKDWRYLVVSGVAFVMSLIIWRVLITRHKFLGKSQVNVIKHRFKNEFSEYVGKLPVVRPGCDP